MNSKEKYISLIGFENGVIYVVSLEDTFSIKDELKSKGAKFSSFLRRWYFSNPVDEYPTIEMTIDECLDLSGKYVDWKLSALDILTERLPKPEIKGEFIGEISKKIAVECKLVNCHSFESYFGYRPSLVHIYTFADDYGNSIVWKTSNSLSGVELNDKVFLVGIVKEHSIYRNNKQTVLTRCKYIID